MADADISSEPIPPIELSNDEIQFIIKIIQESNFRGLEVPYVFKILEKLVSLLNSI